MQIQGGNYQGQHEAIPILDTVRKTGISLILRKFNSLESLESAIDEYAVELEDSFYKVVGGGEEVKAAMKASIIAAMKASICFGERMQAVEVP